ncbi:MAG: LysM peptidoglycan-binding domain-containing protein [Anaerolineae bacterium]|nr:LysM peptidoglycan-binding domain-containing protein [Anaerolineae bacterium]
MKKWIVVFLIVALLLPLGAQTVSASTSSLIHVVRPGENLYRIALRYGTTVRAIAAANHISNPNLIYVGQRLVIPTGGSTVPPGSCIYVVRRGDTLYSIARHFGVSLSTLVSVNGIANPSLIFVGQRLVIPGCGPVPPAPAGVWYTVRAGDTLYSIAARFGVSVWSIVAANHIANPNIIFVGQRLFIPDP